MNISKNRVLRVITIIACCFSWMNLYATECGPKADCLTKPPSANEIKHSGWEICNRTEHNVINISIGFQSSGKWKSKGPEYIYQYECSKILEHISISNLYYLARDNYKILRDGHGEFDHEFCVPSDFRVSHESTDNENVCESRTGYEWVLFDHVQANDSGFLRTIVY